MIDTSSFGTFFLSLLVLLKSFKYRTFKVIDAYPSFFLLIFAKIRRRSSGISGALSSCNRTSGSPSNTRHITHSIWSLARSRRTVLNTRSLWRNSSGNRRRRRRFNSRGSRWNRRVWAKRRRLALHLQTRNQMVGHQFAKKVMPPTHLKFLRGRHFFLWTIRQRNRAGHLWHRCGLLVLFIPCFSVCIFTIWINLAFQTQATGGNRTSIRSVRIRRNCSCRG